MIIHETPVFTLQDKRVFAALVAVFVAGLLVMFAAILALLYLAGTLLNLALSSLVELFTHLASVYAAGDPAVKLAIWLFALLLACKVSPYIARVVRPLILRKLV